jgi:flagellar basal body-associated protein FliL
MTDTDNTPEEHTPNETDAGTPTKKKNRLPIIVVLLLLVILAVGYYAFANKKAAKEEVITLEQAAHQSDSLYNELKSELANYKQENEELYSQIARKEAELESQYSKIKRLIQQAKKDKSARRKIELKLKNLDLELENMRLYVDEQTLDLNELRVENRRLKKEKELLDKKYAEELEERKRLAQAGKDLQDTNEEINKKLKTASVLQTTNVGAKGLRLKNNGDRRGINTAKRTEFVEVCFDIVKNEVCEPGANRFYLRLISPSGAVVSDPNRGSGKLTLFEETEAISYTTSKIFEYNPSVKSLCMEWYAYPNTPFQAGRYRIELYNKGRKVGTYNFDTK